VQNASGSTTDDVYFAIDTSAHIAAPPDDGPNPPNDPNPPGDSTDDPIQDDPIRIAPLVFTNGQALVTAEQQAQAIYVAYFERAADQPGLNWWMDNLVSGQTPDQVATSFAQSEEAHDAFPFLASPRNATEAERIDFVTSVYRDLFNRAPDAEGLNYWNGELAHDQATLSSNAFVVAMGSFILEVIRGAQNSAAGADITTIQNKVDVATYFTEQLTLHGIGYADNMPVAIDNEAHLVIAATDSSEVSHIAQIQAIDTFFAEFPATPTVGITDQHELM
jgi:hypothetical protein